MSNLNPGVAEITFLKNKPKQSVISRRINDSLLPMTKFNFSSKNQLGWLVLWQHLYPTWVPVQSPLLIQLLATTPGKATNDSSPWFPGTHKRCESPGRSFRLLALA